MSFLQSIFDVFSARPKTEPKLKHSVPEKTRVRIIMLCNEIFSGQQSGYMAVQSDYRSECWADIHRMLRYRHGRTAFGRDLTGGLSQDAVGFLGSCPAEQFLDFLEDIFQIRGWHLLGYSPDQLVEDLNVLLRQEALPYHLTGFVRHTSQEKNQWGGEYQTTVTVAQPKVIMRDSEAVHTNAVRPVLELLHHPDFASANAEYLAALEDYRKDDFGDCLTKCCSAFESVLKVICHRKGWSYSQNDTAHKLVKTFLEKTNLDSYFESMLMTTAVLRNKLSASHGAGVQQKQVPRHTALYALNVTASTILLVVGEAA